MRSYRIHTDSETETVTIEPGRKGTMVMHVGLSAGALQGLGPDWPRALRMVTEN